MLDKTTQRDARSGSPARKLQTSLNLSPVEFENSMGKA
jgi:hypothetical protein